MVCAPNAFKGSLSAFEAAAAMARGVAAAGGLALEVPVADGGDGTLDVLLAAAEAGSVAWHEVSGPVAGLVSARLGWLRPGEAVVELAEASGLRRAGRLDALAATSYGTGQLISAALGGGARRILVGVGGSACTDGGAGLLQALGARLLDAGGGELPPGGGALHRLDRLDLSRLDTRLQNCRLEVAVDVRSPLLGPDGAAAVFGPQKGASPEQVGMLERGLERLATVAERDAGAAGLAALAGAGAAGGCGFALALIGAELRAGAELVCDEVGLDAALGGAALVLTGEGRLDSQTAAGKAPAEVGERSRRHGVPCAAIAGSVEDRLGGLFDATYSLAELAAGRDPYADAPELLAEAAALAVRDRQAALSRPR